MEEGLEIPEAVAMDILSRLPVKSVVRFRCVCKPWSCSFQTSHFITKHYHNSVKNNNNNPSLLVKRCHGNTRNVGLSYLSALSTDKDPKFETLEDIHSPFFKKRLDDFVVCGPCNGLLCLSGESGNAALWNPSTREFKIIPETTHLRPPLAMSPALGPPWLMFTTFDGLGFGFDPATDDYKIVRFVTNLTYEDDEAQGLVDEPIYQVELYSLQSDSWKQLPVPEVIIEGFLLLDNYNINGFCYWSVTGVWRDRLLSFDIANEKFLLLPLPNSGENSDQSLLFDFNGLLGVMVYPRYGTEKSLDSWVLNMNGSWTKQFRIESIPGVERPLGFWKNGEIFLESLNNELVLFDPATREVKNLGINSHGNDEMQLIAYFESLVPINGRSEHKKHIIRKPARKASSGRRKLRRK